MTIDAIDRKLIAATQGGLPLTPHPLPRWQAGWACTRTRSSAGSMRMQGEGMIRRVALAPNHYALGLIANGMSVWDVDDADSGSTRREGRSP